MEPGWILLPLYYLNFQKRTDDSQFLKLETLLEIRNEKKTEEMDGRIIDRGEIYGSDKLQLIFNEVKYFLQNPDFDFTSLLVLEDVAFSNQEILEYLGKIYDLMNENKELLGIE